ncbi:MAG: tetratricopeptide repeat protein [Candidatus Thalassarchaeaceae archaeon]|nr:tetratricopeptide repeat protein [Candidatus Thalassarchaeaceae archaeon]
MPEHGHDNCPHCDTSLEGGEATCPSCSGPLFGIAPKTPIIEENHPVIVTGITETTIGDISVPTYTPGSTTNEGEVESHQSDPSEHDEDSLIQQGEALGLAGYHTGAINAFNQAIAINPSNHMAWFNRGVMSEASGDIDEAIKAFNIALDNCPGHGATSANMAVLMERLGHTDKAVQHAHSGLVAFPGHPALVEIIERHGGEIPVATIDTIESNDEPIEDEITVQIEDDGSNDENLWAEPQGTIRTMNDEGPASNAVIEDTQPEQNTEIDLDGIADQAADLIRAGDPAAALESLRDLLPGAACEHPQSWRVAAGAMARLDLEDSAIEAFEYALDLDNSDSSAWFNLGALKRRRADHSGAADCFSRALELDSGYAKAANGLALASLEIGAIENAIHGFRVLLSLEPGHSSASDFASLLIDLAEGEGRVIELVESLPTTLPAGPEMASEALRHLQVENTRENIILRARANTIISNHAESVTLWKSLLESDKSDATLWMGLAGALTAAGSADMATACREKARALGADVEEPTPAPVEHNLEQANDTLVDHAEQTVTNHIEESDDDPWGALSDDSEETSLTVESEISSEEITQHESALDTISEPEPITYEPIGQDVDLAAAALEAQANIMEDHQVMADSSSVANQDIEWYNKGLELLSKDRFSEALSCFDRALPSFKDDNAMAIKVLNGRGNCFYYMEQYKKAIESYFKAFGIDKKLTTGNALYNMGTAYAELESYENAIHCFNQAMGKEVGEPLKGENKKRCKEQIRRCKLLLKEQKKKS